jgi:hypothetical protein
LAKCFSIYFTIGRSQRQSEQSALVDALLSTEQRSICTAFFFAKREPQHSALIDALGFTYISAFSNALRKPK